jgi:hypothetical protein
MRINSRTGVRLQLIDGETSTGVYADYTLTNPLHQFAVQGVANSSTAVVYLQGTLQGTTAPSWTTIATWESSADGSGVLVAADSSWAGVPMGRIRGVLEAGASSGGVSAWVTASV